MAGLFPAPKIVSVPRDEATEPSPEPVNVDIHRVACMVLVGMTAASIAATLNIDPELVGSPEVAEHLHELSARPDLALPTRAEAYATLRYVMMYGKLDRDRMRAAEMAMDILGPANQTPKLSELARSRAV